jgi:hypothetical protein
VVNDGSLNYWMVNGGFENFLVVVVVVVHGIVG